MRIESIGNFAKTTKFLTTIKRGERLRKIDAYCKKGVEALALATPVDSGKTAESWSYEILTSPYGTVIVWTNSNVIDGFPVAIGLQYGHGTGGSRNHGYVVGRDYINPALRPIFDEIAEDVWREVTMA